MQVFPRAVMSFQIRGNMGLPRGDSYRDNKLDNFIFV